MSIKFIAGVNHTPIKLTWFNVDNSPGFTNEATLSATLRDKSTGIIKSVEGVLTKIEPGILTMKLSEADLIPGTYNMRIYAKYTNILDSDASRELEIIIETP